jgi:uncharacterized protein (TIGR00266 family)
MRSTIIGNILPVLEFELDRGDMVIAETGQLSWMTGGVELHTTTNTAGNSGFFGAVGRALSGGGLFMTEYSTPYAPGTLAFAAKIPGHLVELHVQPGQGYMIHKHGFLCATPGVQLGTGFQQSLGGGLFGGNGFLLQKLTGVCTAWVELGGEVIERMLAPGEVIRVHPGHVGMFEDRVNFGITTLRGVRNIFFGGDGLFLAELTGPGRVWLQTLTLPNMAHALAPYMAQESGGTVETAAEAGIAATVLKGLFSR